VNSVTQAEEDERMAAEVKSEMALVQVGTPTESESLKYMLRTLDKFRSFAQESLSGVQARHSAEQSRLQASLSKTQDQGTNLALSQSINQNQQSLLEVSRVYNNMVNFAGSMEQFLTSATSKGGGCEIAKCGSHSTCTETTLGPQCVCKEGYVGTGKDCAAPPEFMPHHLLLEGPSKQIQATEINVATFGKSNVAVVFVDVSNGRSGRVVVGHIREAGMAMLSPPESFTQSAGQAYNPVVKGTDANRILIAWRDQDKDGVAWLRAAGVGAAGIRGADQHIEWGEPVQLGRSQSHKMALVSLPNDRAVVAYSDKVEGSKSGVADEIFGNSMLVEIGASGAITSLGTFRFSDYPVCRLEVTKLTPSSFVIAARSGQATDEMDSSITTNQEAVATFGEMAGDDLVYDPNSVNLEPKGKNIWARGVSLIAPNTFAYAYQRGESQQMMMAVLKLNATTHKMQVVHSPTELRQGLSPYVSMLSVPYTPKDPHTLVYYEGDQNSMVNLCKWDAQRLTLNQCEDFVWLQGKVKSVSGVHLQGGKSFMVFTTPNGVPYYGVFGISKK
jgi:hypothetical protein